MTDAMAAMLDELMGKTRNANKEEQGKKMDFNDPDVCQYALAGLCPYTLFSNTKSDLGACSLLSSCGAPHSPECLRYAYKTQLSR